MEVHIDPQTAGVLRSKRPEPQAGLRLAALNEGCGCGADVWFEMNWDSPRSDDISLKTEGITVLIDPRSREFFDPVLMVSHQLEKDAFSLKSRNQIYLNHIHL
ncbi:iron-sulfur cluster biosynthesis family protein [Salinithrix halophila]|uniref:Iron-sulfur cluster biosynthesis family protein n=1 Tax=Salinithrix halophila TaxID=1485204 RepID=A0ABV8JGY8_9BACL